jgi:non-specific serine/threonine protein kinase/serine/threonine-protein kinase
VTESGQPYFAMEWVEGTRLDRYFTSATDLDRRLNVFLQVCEAVQHAHEKQILHRDLKPSNVMVTEVGGRPTAKVIDFGIAQVADRPAEEPRFGESESVYGTPEYLSPEAFEGQFDSRSEVYSLGVMLYELVAGRRPFERGDRDLAAFREEIAAGGPPPASQLVESGLTFTTDRERQRWTARIRGDLDAIAARAVQPDPSGRYGSVADLASDVARFLRHEPVAARPPTPWGALRLLARRRRGAVLASCLALLALTAGTIGTTVGMLRARAEAESTARALAEAEALADFLTEIFDVSSPNRARGEAVTAREVLDEGARRLKEGLAGQPLVRARFARTVGDVYTRLGFFGESEPLLQEALHLYTEHLGDEHLEVAKTAHSLGVMKTKAGELEAAKGYFETALAIQEKARDADPEDLALTRYHLGVLAYQSDELALAETYFNEACPAWQGLEGREELWARCLEAFGAVHKGQGHLDEATALLEQSLALRRRVLGNDHLHVAASLDNLCWHYRTLMRLAAAEAACQEALDIRRRLVGDEHPDTGRSLSELARIRYFRGDLEAAEALIAEVLRSAESPANTDRFRHSIWLLQGGWLAWNAGRWDLAESRYRQALEIRSDLLGAEHYATGLPRIGLGIVQWKRGELERARKTLETAGELLESHYGRDSVQFAWVPWALGGVYRDRADSARGDLERAAELYEAAAAIRSEAYPEGHPYREILASDLAELKRKQEAAAASPGEAR